MNIELSVTNITAANRREKFTRAAYALSDQLGLHADIEAPWMEKTKTHKYIKKEWVNDHWEYKYPQ
ncbi:MAG: hypothetical protein LBD29_04000, partial [Treponema sp.]|nr:hypothetical protein [Treponema sp.]